MPIEVNRLFFALWPDATTRAACDAAARALRVKMQPGGRATDPERFHLTLAFLGSTVSAGQEAAALEVANSVHAAPFTLRLDHAGSFRKGKSVWWLGARETSPGLALLHQRLHDGLLEARVLPDRARFAPHLTIVRDAQQALPQTAIQPLDWAVRDFVLVRSRLDRQPPDYEVIGRWSLKEGENAAPGQLGLWENAGSRQNHQK